MAQAVTDMLNHELLVRGEYNVGMEPILTLTLYLFRSSSFHSFVSFLSYIFKHFINKQAGDIPSGGITVRVGSRFLFWENRLQNLFCVCSYMIFWDLVSHFLVSEKG